MDKIGEVLWIHLVNSRGHVLGEFSWTFLVNFCGHFYIVMKSVTPKQNLT